jgi:hypothetical protein
MTKAHALKRLLQLGPLTTQQMVEITGWTPEQVSNVRMYLKKQGILRKSRLFNGWYVATTN